jgi:hypothetical protein
MLLARAEVPDDYSTALRVAGLYALTRYPFAAGVREWESEMSAAFARAPGSSLPVVRYAPPPAQPRSREAIGRLLVASAANPLGLPEPDAEDLADLLAAYAPSFEVEIGGDYDRFGQLRWLRERRTPSVDAAEQVVYAHASRTLYRGHALLQLVYTIWFPERPPREAGDILAGTLDGLVWRVTLAPDGEPLVYDTIHPCGCYHMFFPTPRAHVLPPPTEIEEWAFSPYQLPRVQDGERPVPARRDAHALHRARLARAGNRTASRTTSCAITTSFVRCGGSKAARAAHSRRMAWSGDRAARTPHLLAHGHPLGRRNAPIGTACDRVRRAAGISTMPTCSSSASYSICNDPLAQGRDAQHSQGVCRNSTAAW